MLCFAFICEERARVDSIAVSVLVVILVDIDKSETSRLVLETGNLDFAQRAKENCTKIVQC